MSLSNVLYSIIADYQNYNLFKGEVEAQRNTNKAYAPDCCGSAGSGAGACALITRRYSQRRARVAQNGVQIFCHP